VVFLFLGIFNFCHYLREGNGTLTIRNQSMEKAPQTHLAVPSLVVTPEWLAAHLDHPALRLLDVRSLENYNEGHLPGAVQVELAQLSSESNGVPGMLLAATAFATKMSAYGVDSSKAVVLYDDNWGMPAARVLWALARYGHTNAAVLTGGWDRWQEEGHPHSSEPVQPTPAHFQVKPVDEHLAERTWVQQHLHNPDVILIDTRTPGEYAQGHLPGAVNWDWMNAVPVAGWDLMKPADELRATLESLGATPEKAIVTYCRSGARAAHTYLVLRMLGYPRVRNYDGSWLEWSHYQKGASH
jgi:thiosulfate/3-mercaptopyruvate sulfurtransferase